jgi:two-component system cell cycle sensor histidine kinase/response regulator CckA
MPAGGRLIIKTRAIDLDATLAAMYEASGIGRYVMIQISDTGHGMDPETQAHIFEPFFTTKEVGKGTGLGLATVYGIVKQSGGSITVDSEPGCGAVFRILLPAVEPQRAVERQPARPAAHGSETLLVVEDGVRTLVARVLQSHGYTVLVARNGQEALRICEVHRGPIHGVVTDVVMPGISGYDLVQRLTALRSGLRVLYMSGYTEDEIVRQSVSGEQAAFIQKPMSPSALANKVRDVLDGIDAHTAESVCA